MSTGWGRSYLAGGIDDGRWKYSPVTVVGHRDPNFAGSVKDFMRLHPELSSHLTNEVKICSSCTKSCGKTLHACNNCGGDIAEHPIERSDNALMGFVYGIQFSDNYYLGTSIRYQDADFLVYDDIMQTTVVHLNSIPSYVYVPDFRHLFEKPIEGLALVRRLYDNAVTAAVSILSNNEFLSTFFSPESLEIMKTVGTREFVLRHVFAGFNYPPSQCQLHLQFILPPYMPYHAVLLEEGKHGSVNRFFTYEYIVRALEVLVYRGEVIRLSEIDGLSGEHLVDTINKRANLDYKVSFTEAMNRQKANDAKLSNWKQSDFKYLVARIGNDKICLPLRDPDNSVDADKITRHDKKVLESYGKGHLGLQFYSFPRSPGHVASWLGNSN